MKIPLVFLDVEARYKTCENLITEFDRVQTEIEIVCEEDQLQGHYKEREDFENRYYVALHHLKETILSIQPAVAPKPPPATVDMLQNVLLPKIKLPSYSGNWEEWIKFKLNFSTIDSNQSLNELQKFQFLKAALEGSASRLIEGVESAGNKFTEAWRILCERIDKKQFLVETHLKSILNIPQLHKESYNSFRNMLDNISKHFGALDSMQITKLKLWDILINYIISTKLDKNSLREWKELKYRTELPTLQEFMYFLKRSSILGRTEFFQNIIFSF